MTTYPFTTEGLSSALAALGSTPAHVADTLLDGGHRGRPGCEHRCPVAEALSDVYRYPDYSVAVLAEPPDQTLFVEVYRFADSQRLDVDLPEPVAQFVRRFDHGDYAELDRTRAVA